MHTHTHTHTRTCLESHLGEVLLPSASVSAPPRMVDGEMQEVGAGRPPQTTPLLLPALKLKEKIRKCLDHVLST